MAIFRSEFLKSCNGCHVNEFFFLYQLLIDCVGINMAYLKLAVGKLSNTVTLMELVLLSLNSKCKGTFDTKF